MTTAGKRFILSLAVCWSATVAAASTSLPPDVSAFIERRDTCDHFRGEFPDPPDSERMKEVNDNLKKYCPGTDAALARLKKRYGKRKDVVQLLDAYEESIE